jgi:membrane fusion protein (multidrug efflux system)
MEATVDVADQSGLTLADTPRNASQVVASTTVFDSIQHDADAEVAKIVAANGGGHMAVAKSASPAASAPVAAADGSAQVASAGAGKAHRHHKQS